MLFYKELIFWFLSSCWVYFQPDILPLSSLQMISHMFLVFLIFFFRLLHIFCIDFGLNEHSPAKTVPAYRQNRLSRLFIFTITSVSETISASFPGLQQTSQILMVSRRPSHSFLPLLLDPFIQYKLGSMPL